MIAAIPAQARRHLSAVAIIFCLGALLYVRTLPCDFVFDDQPHITDNPSIRLTRLGLRNMFTAAFDNPTPTRPVANLTFALNYYLGKYQPAGYHWLNIIIHSLNAFLVYLLAGATFSLDPVGSDRSGPQPRHFAAALTVGLLFLAHPVQSQAVSYIIQRMTSLAATFYLATLLVYVYTRCANTTAKRRWGWGTATVLWLLALGSKEISAMLPVAVLLYEWCFFQQFSLSWLRANPRYPILATLLFMLPAAVYLVATAADSPLAPPGAGESPVFNPITHLIPHQVSHLLTQARVLILYISLLFYPHPDRLNLIHPFAASQSLFDPPSTFVALMTLAGMLLGGMWLARRQRLAAFAIFWFLLHLAIESALVGLDPVFEHRLYLPLFGVALATVHYGRQLLPSTKAMRYLAAIAVIGLLAAGTFQRNRVWQHHIALWSDVVAKNPASPKARYNLGSDLLRAGQPRQAVAHLHRAVALNPGYTRAHNNLGVARARLGDDDGAAKAYRAALALNPDFAVAHNNLGVILEKRGDLNRAADHYATAVRIKPDFGEAHGNLGAVMERKGRRREALVHYLKALDVGAADSGVFQGLAIDLERHGRPQAAIESYFKALESDPYDPRAYNNLGVLLTREGLNSQAVWCFRTALTLKEGDPAVHNNLGVALSNLGREAEASDQYQRALALKPDYAAAHSNLGIALVRSEQFRLAIEHLERAQALDPQNHDTRRNLAIAREQLRDSEEKK